MNSSRQDRPVQYMADIEASIRRYPLEALGIGFLTGFVVGGGQHSRIGQGLIGFAARFAVRQVTMTALSETLKSS
jgi:uncharacterized membrane protein (Fun14 family)